MRTLLALILAPCFTAVSAGPQQANGIKMGEVSQDSAIVWTRLTRGPDQVDNGKDFQPNPDPKRRSRNYPDLHGMNGAVPGMEGEVRVRYRAAEGDREEQATDWVEVTAESDFIHAFTLTGLRPGTRYEVEAEARATKTVEPSSTTRGRFVTAPMPDTPSTVRFTVVTGQEWVRRDDPVKGHKIYPQMLQLDPHFFVHTGDIIYYDKDRPFADNLPLARFKWNRMYAMPFQRAFHNEIASYFIKDDHDTTKNDSWPGQDYGDLSWEQGLALFREQVPMGERTYRTRRWGKDLQIWMMEGRDFRSPNRMLDGPDKTIWGEEQKQWLFDSVKASDATFRIVISPTPIVGPDRDKKNDNHANEGFTDEGNEVRAFLAKQENLFSVCGDRHWQYVSVDPVTGLREYSCGPTSDAHAGGFSEGNRSDMHQYLNVVGGFLEVEIRREGDKAQAVFRHRGVDGSILNEDLQVAQ